MACARVFRVSYGSLYGTGLCWQLPLGQGCALLLGRRLVAMVSIVCSCLESTSDALQAWLSRLCCDSRRVGALTPALHPFLVVWCCVFVDGKHPFL